MMQGIDRAPLVVVNGLILHVSAPETICWYFCKHWYQLIYSEYICTKYILLYLSLMVESNSNIKYIIKAIFI